MVQVGMPPVIGIIGGSGIYDIDMENARWQKIASPWGEPSDDVRRGEIGGHFQVRERLTLFILLLLVGNDVIERRKPRASGDHKQTRDQAR